MVTKKTWQEFTDSGLMFACNQFLHLFGWAIVREIDDESGEILDVYPTRVKFRGFDEESTRNGYLKVSRYMAENADELLKEAEDNG